jgi:hypothetical protein
MTDFLATHIHAVAVGPDLVVLDLRADTYFCLVGAAEFVDIHPGGAVSFRGQAASAAMREAGMLDTVSPSRPRIPPPPKHAVGLEWAEAPSMGDRCRFFSTAVQMLGTPGDATVADSLRAKPLGRRAHAAVSQDEIVRQTALFARWLPWVPNQGACLYRASFLRRFLAESGLTADWVFGVTTWPFSAHCWLQAGDLLLDDDLDRVATYTPLMVVAT